MVAAEAVVVVVKQKQRQPFLMEFFGAGSRARAGAQAEDEEFSGARAEDEKFSVAEEEEEKEESLLILLVLSSLYLQKFLLTFHLKRT